MPVKASKSPQVLTLSNVGKPSVLPQAVPSASDSGDVTPTPDIGAASPQTDVGAVSGAASPVPSIVRSMITNPDAPPTPPQGVVPTLAPQPKPGFLSRLGTGLSKALPVIGAIGGGMEAAGSPRHEAPNLDRLVNTNLRMGQMQMEQERLRNVEEPMAQAHADYFKNMGSQYDLVPMGTDANGDPIMVPKRAAGQVASANIGAASKEKVEGMKETGQMAIARLKAGAPMHIDADIANLAGQPQLANQDIGGTTLTNFAKVLGAKGYKVQDLGNDGLWVIDRGGNRVKQISVSSPSIARGEAFARARAEYTPVNVFDENGNLTAVSQAQQLQSGIPSAQTVFSEQGPTSQSRTMAQSANTVSPHIDELQQFIANNPGLVGPATGRINKFLSGTVGSTGNAQLDEQLGKLRGNYMLMKGALARTHFGGRSGVQAAQYFSDLMDAQTSPEGVIGVLESVKPYIQGYSEMQNFTPQRVAAAAPSGGGKKTAAKPSTSTENIPEYVRDPVTKKLVLKK